MTRVINKEGLRLKPESKKLLKRELNTLTTKKENLLVLMICKMYIFKLKQRREKNTTSPSTLREKLVISLIILKPEDLLVLLNDSKIYFC